MSNRTVFITSGAAGLGYAMVQAFMAAGWNVFFTYRNSEANAQTLRAAAGNSGIEVDCCKADLLSENATVAAADLCLERMGRVDAFVHNFGPFVFEHVPVADYSPNLWTHMLEGNLTNFLWLYQKFIPHMRQQRFGRIVTLGYAGAGTAAGWRYRGPYAAAKSALAALTRTIAREERSHGITANMVCPGDIRGAHKADRIRDVASAGDANRPPVGEDVARLIVYLCDPESSQLNGTVTDVDGGQDVLHTNWTDRR